MSSVTFLDPQKQSVHSMLSDMAEDAGITSALVIYQNDDGFNVSGSLMTPRDLCAVAMMVDELARQSLFDEQ